MDSQSKAASVPVVIVARNNLDLLQEAVRSALDQDVPTTVLVVNNGSTDSTLPWLQFKARQDHRVWMITFSPQHSVAHAWNSALRFLFEDGAERVLVINQDTVLRRDAVRWLAAEQAMFVTGVGSADPTSIVGVEDEVCPVCRKLPSYGDPCECFRAGYERVFVTRYATPRSDAARPHPDFSCFMISRECYERVGPFDENFRGAFGEDCEFHVRMHANGIRAYCIDLPFWHVGGGSQTVKRADPDERARIMAQAEKNRDYFKRKVGFAIGSPEYYAYFGSEPPK